jgi:hypothetical protein
MIVERAILFAAEEVAPKGVDLLAEALPTVARAAEKAIAGRAEPVLAQTSDLLPKIEIGRFSDYSPYESNQADHDLAEHLLDNPSHHQFLSARWSAGPTEFVDQWQFRVAPLNRPLEVNRINTCTALSVTDRSAGLHYLAHIDHDTSVSDIMQSVSRLDLSQSAVRLLPGPRFYDLPGLGTHDVSRANVEKTVSALQQLTGGLKNFKFVHSDETDLYAMVSHEGNLYEASATET